MSSIDCSYKPVKQQLWSDVFGGVGLKDGQRVLDLACGPGVISRLIAESHPNSQITAMDLNADLLAVAREKRLALDWIRFFCPGRRLRTTSRTWAIRFHLRRDFSFSTWRIPFAH